MHVLNTIPPASLFVAGLTGLFWLLLAFGPGGIEAAVARHRVRLLQVVVLLLFGLAVILALVKRFNVDEFEHIHSAWYIHRGALPFRDFFQHHHPLLWPMLVPIFWVFGHTVTAVIVVRLLFVAQLAAAGYLVYRLVARLGGSREAGLAAVILLFANVMFVLNVIEIRPDVPQTLFGLLALLLLLAHLQAPRSRTVFLSGMSAALAFLFLQKALFFLLVLGPVLLVLWLAGRLRFSCLLRFGLGFGLPLVIFVIVLWALDIWEDYLLTNWVVNLRFAPGDTFTPLTYWRRFVLKDALFWGAGLFGLAVSSLGRKPVLGRRLIVFFTLGATAGLFLLKRPYGHNFLLLLALLSVLGGTGFMSFLERWRTGWAHRLAVLFLFLVLPVGFLVREAGNTNRAQIQAVIHVLEHTAPDERVYDGRCAFNLFRPDLHYFWYSLLPTRGLGTYNRVTGGRHGDYDTCRLIRAENPRFISDYLLDLRSCGLDTVYDVTPFPHIFVRRQGELE